MPINKTAGFRPVDAEAANGIEVDLDATDPSKAVDRTRGSIFTPDKTEDESGDEGKFLDRSRAVQKRMARMKRSFDQQLAERDAEHQRQLAERDARLERLEARREEAPPAADEAAHELEMKALEKQHEAALEKGDSAEATKLAREMSRKEAAFATKKTLALVEQSNKNREAAATKREPAAAQRAAATTTPAAANEFIDANLDWWEDDEFQVERSAAEVIHRALIKEGSDPDSRSHYVKLNKRLKAKFPTLEVATPKRDEDDEDELDEEAGESKQRRARAPTVGIDRGPANAPGVGNRVRLTPEDVKNMREFGLNPDDNKQVLRYTREKQATEAASRRD